MFIAPRFEEPFPLLDNVIIQSFVLVALESPA